MVGFAHNAYGEPSSGVIAHFEYNGTFHSVKTGLKGFANATFQVNTSKSSIVISVNYTYSTLRSSKTTTQTEYQVDPKERFSGFSVIPGIVNPYNTSSLGFLMLYVGSNGSSAPQIGIYVSNYSIGESQYSAAKNYSFKFNASNFVVKSFFPSVTYGDINNTYAVVAKNNSDVFQVFSMIKPQYVYVIGPLTDYVPMTQSSLQILVFSGTSQILGFLIPILAIFAGYLTYGRDRTSGVLESVMKRPVTRGGVIISRFTSNVIAIIIAVTLSVIFSSLIIHHYFGMYLSVYFSLYFLWTYVVEGTAFLAIVYFFSHVVKSQSTLLGGSIGVFIVFDLFWGIIPVAVLSALNVSSSTSAYILANIAFDYASPAGYSSLVQAMFTDKFGLFGAETINPAAYGIISPTLIIAGILWMIIPFFFAYTLARYKD
jgi:ABC-2 type transport system permease protein